MKIEITKKEEGHVDIHLDGSFDASNSNQVKEEFTDCLNEGYKNYSLDFEKVEFVDSSGLGVLVGFYKKVKIGDGQLSLKNLNDSVMKIFELTQLDKVFKIV